MRAPSLAAVLLATILPALLLPTAPAAGEVTLDADLLAGAAARALGPATMSGRIGDVEAVASDPDVVYVGSASGGLWKSTDGALTFEPIFDDQEVASIGAIAVHPQAPDLVWVGTGEGNPRNSASVGWGIYKSRDGGETWEHLGLEKTEKIHRIVLHPTDPDVAWVAALGTSWGESEERGVFKTTDGGQSWEKVLYVNETTGASDLVMNPANPHHLIAATWQHRRWPYFFTSGGPGSGLHVSRDGGETWTELTPEDGLPEGELGRIGLAFAPSDPSRVYAIVEAEGDDNHFLRSDDGGKSWRTVAKSTEQEIGNRPFYYSDIVVDPQDPNRVYSLWSLVSVTRDGGTTWEILVPFAQAHPDHHSMWISPDDPSLIYLGNDGGVYVSRDRGGSWRFVRNLPLAQLYHVRVDDEQPYNVYFGLQDNGSWVGPSEVWENAGIRNHHWQEINFGDGFDAVPDPKNPCCGWAMSQEGFLSYWNRSTGERRLARPEAPPGEEKLRYNWNAALALDPWNPDVVYFGSQYVHKSTDRGRTWEVISPDLTTDNEEWQKQAESGGLTPDVTGAENYVSLLAIEPSPVEEGVIWTGSDDGRLHVTRDGGETWTSVEENVPGVPEHTWIPHVEASRFDGGEAFVVFDDHRRADWTPYVYRTRDYGATWERLAGEGDIWGYALSIAQDPNEREMLWVGTEFGLFVTPDGGGTWLPFDHGVPTTSVMDLAIQEREDALVIGTHGRGVFVIDDLEPVRRALLGDAEDEPRVLAAPPAIQYVVQQTGSSRFPGDGEFRGENAPYGNAIYLWLPPSDDLPHPDEEKERARKARKRAEKLESMAEKEAMEGDKESQAEEGEETVEAESPDGPQNGPPKATVRVSRADDDEVVREMELPVQQGVNKIVWNFRADDFEMPPGTESGFFGNFGPMLPPGTYDVGIEVPGHDDPVMTRVDVRIDPRLDVGADALAERYETLRRAGTLQELVVEALDRLASTRGDVDTVLAKLEARKDAEETGSETEAATGSSDAESGEAESGEAKDDDESSPEEALKKAAGELKKKIAELEDELRTPPDAKGIPAEGDRPFDGLRSIGFVVGGTWEAPPPVQLTYLERAEASLAEILPEVNALYADDVAAFRQKVRELEIRLLEEEEPLAMPAE